jgi:hypothetical protein
MVVRQPGSPGRESPRLYQLSSWRLPFPPQGAVGKTCKVANSLSNRRIPGGAEEGGRKERCGVPDVRPQAHWREPLRFGKDTPRFTASSLPSEHSTDAGVMLVARCSERWQIEVGGERDGALHDALAADKNA